jgi:hypothetical protein
MTAGTHDDGRLFGMGADGTIWTEPALSLDDTAAGHAAVVTVAPGTPAWDVFTGAAMVCPCEACGADVYREHDGTWHHD